MDAQKPELIPISIFAQDPKMTRSPVTVHVRGSMLPGPVGDRIAVFDYNRDRDEVYGAARPKKDGTFPKYEPDDLRFHQLNAYAITARAAGLVERELGRDLRWGFEGSRLIILPHAGYMANAFYSENSHTLQFYSFVSENSSRVFHTALSHDIVAHEAGHAILDAVRGRYTESLEPETAALHEAVGDLTAMFAALSHDVVKKKVIDPFSRGRKNLISEIAEHFEGDDQNLRSLIHVAGVRFNEIIQPHQRSLQLSRAIYEILRRFFKKERRARRPPMAALETARVVTQRMTIRALGYLPPMDATFRDFGLAMLSADTAANPYDAREYREIVRDVFIEHKILTRTETETASELNDEPWRDLPRTWPRAGIRDAYMFLDRNRDRLALGKYPLYRDFVVSDLQVTTMPRYPTAIDQVIVGYEYPVDIELAEKAFGNYRGHWITIYGGGTLVFDVEGKLRHHAKKPVTKDRVRRLKVFLKTAGHFLAPSKLTLDDEIRTQFSGSPWILEIRSDQIVPRTNPSACCGRCRHHKGGAR